jgi:hypothetical protein
MWHGDFTGVILVPVTNGPASVGISHRLGAGPSNLLERSHLWNPVVITALKKFANYLAQQRLRRKVLGALEVNRRAGVRNDGLSLKSMRNRLEVEWQAREIHPWDKGLPPERAAQRFVQQCLEDVDAAISRLFATLPDTDEIVLRVLDPISGEPIVAGTVVRAEAASASAGSVGMKLKSLGLVYRLANWQFESLGN